MHLIHICIYVVMLNCTLYKVKILFLPDLSLKYLHLCNQVDLVNFYSNYLSNINIKQIVIMGHQCGNTFKI